MTVKASPYFYQIPPSNPHTAAGSLWNNCTNETLPLHTGEWQRDSEQRFPDSGAVSLRQAVFVVVSDGSLIMGTVIFDITPVISPLLWNRAGRLTSLQTKRIE